MSYSELCSLCQKKPLFDLQELNNSSKFLDRWLNKCVSINLLVADLKNVSSMNVFMYECG